MSCLSACGEEQIIVTSQLVRSTSVWHRCKGAIVIERTVRETIRRTVAVMFVLPPAVVYRRLKIRENSGPS